MPQQVVVLFGGRSAERRVSVASAQNISHTLSDAQLLFQDEKGNVFECAREKLLAHQRPFETDFATLNQPFATSLQQALPRLKRDAVYFLGFHGGDGEDGTVQKLLEKSGLAFTASGSDASANAANKRIAKSIVGKVGLTVLPELEVDPRASDCVAKVKAFFKQHGGLILKPLCGGSSIGLFRAKTENDIPEVCEQMKSVGEIYLIEPFTVGREITVGVCEDGKRTFSLPPSEVRTFQGHDFDYEGKYLGRASQEITPAEINESETKACQQMAVAAHKALKCFGYTRTDLILTDKGPIYIETNTLPGLTRASFFPQQLAAAKIDFREFLLKQVQLAWDRAYS